MSDRLMTKEFATWFFALYFRGHHHIPDEIKEWGTGWAVYTHNELATWDWDSMTRLVVMAHDYHVRASFVPKGMSKAYLVIHPRPRGTTMSEHPELDWNVARIRDQLRAYDVSHLKPLKDLAFPEELKVEPLTDPKVSSE